MTKTTKTTAFPGSTAQRDALGGGLLPPRTTDGPTREGNWLQTFSGVMFYPIDPRPEEVLIEDIAHSLSNQCRYAGHTNTFYSVAEHCYRMSYIVPKEDALWALLHDASEAYLVDLPRPIKHYSKLGEVYIMLENRVMRAVVKRFNLPIPCPFSVHRADNIMLSTEKRDLMKLPPKPWVETEKPLKGVIFPMNPCVAEIMFLERFASLEQTGAKNRRHARV